MPGLGAFAMITSTRSLRDERTTVLLADFIKQFRKYALYAKAPTLINSPQAGRVVAWRFQRGYRTVSGNGPYSYLRGFAAGIGNVARLTLFRRGTVKMSHPTVIFFGPDTRRMS